VILAAGLGQAKLSFPLAFLVVAPCWRRPFADRRIWLTCMTGLAMALGSAWLWSHLSEPLQIPVRPDLPVDPSAQISWVLANPFKFLGVIGATLGQNGWDTCRQVIGVFGWLQTSLPNWIYVGGWLALLVAPCLSREANQMTRAFRVLCGLVAFGTTLLIYFALYLTFTGVAAEIVEGIQGRYFLGLLIPLGLTFLNGKLSRPGLARPVTLGLYAFLLVANAAGIWIQFRAGFG